MGAEHIPAVTVLMPVHNSGSDLLVAVQSVLSQDFSDFELLIIDDGSSDGCIELLDALPDSRIRIVRQRHAGIVSALNRGLELSHGRYIARHDGDDVSFPQRLTKQLDFLDANPQVDLLGTRGIVFMAGGATVGLLPFSATHGSLTARAWAGIPLPHPSWMGRRDWFLRHRYRDVLRAEDQELLLRASFTSCYACLDEVLFGYRQNQFSLLRTLSARRSLLSAQLKIFLLRGNWFDATRAAALVTLKVLIDLITALPGGEGLWFRRMSYPAAASDTAEVRRLLKLTVMPEKTVKCEA